MNLSPNLPSLEAESPAAPRRAFTLVELMVVIVIIGIIAGFALPAVFNAVKSARQGAYKLEIDTLADAVEKYRTKYGDYPPDGSSWQIMERHLRKAFPQILQSELNLLNPTITAAADLNFQGWSGNPWNKNTMAGVVAGVRNDFDQTVVIPDYAAGHFKVMDPAEALVFFLGGFSSNPQRPFTGAGGPFVVTVGTPGDPPPADGLSGGQTLQYNIQRSNAFFDFKTDRLSIEQELVGGIPVTISHDEEAFLGLGSAEDLLPVYLGRPDIERSAPVVYFDARTYGVMKQDTMGNNVPYMNFFQRSSTTASLTPATEVYGAVRPLISGTLRTPPFAGGTPSLIDWMRQYLFLEDKKFQVLGPGLDDIYGGRILQDFSAPSINEIAGAFISIPSGDSYKTTHSSSVASNRQYRRLLLPKTSDLYQLSTGILDNSANCIEGSTYFNSLTVPGSK